MKKEDIVLGTIFTYHKRHIIIIGFDKDTYDYRNTNIVHYNLNCFDLTTGEEISFKCDEIDSNYAPVIFIPEKLKC